MAELFPFKGIRYNQKISGDLSLNVCPPFDSISSTLQRKLYDVSNYNTVRLELGLRGLDEDPYFSANMEQAQTLQADMQAIAEKLQKEQETLSQEEIVEMQKEYQEKSQDLEFIAGKIQQARQETAQKIMMDLRQPATVAIRQLMAAKQIKLLLDRPAQGQQTVSAVLDFNAELDITDDVTSILDVNVEASEAPTE